MTVADNRGGRCQASVWKGKPEDKMAEAARCKKVVGHAGYHLDKNGNNFVGSGLQAEVVVVRKKVSA